MYHPRETTNIYAATLIVLMCLVMFLSGYTLTHAYIKGLLRAIVIYVTSMAFLICLFFPKMLLLRKYANTEEEKAMINAKVMKFSCRPVRVKRSCDVKTGSGTTSNRGVDISGTTPLDGVDITGTTSRVEISRTIATVPRESQSPSRVEYLEQV